mmetsp:Transcript_907/g.3106  ORF Transcript_907/g.3106 Transcript_907/m.3106 type:complete len:232 (-) Transcript_907:12-707(-)
MDTCSTSTSGTSWATSRRSSACRGSGRPSCSRPRWPTSWASRAAGRGTPWAMRTSATCASRPTTSCAQGAASSSRSSSSWSPRACPSCRRPATLPICATCSSCSSPRGRRATFLLRRSRTRSTPSRGASTTPSTSSSTTEAVRASHTSCDCRLTITLFSAAFGGVARGARAAGRSRTSVIASADRKCGAGVVGRAGKGGSKGVDGQRQAQRRWRQRHQPRAAAVRFWVPHT